jgi:hypothetical protein
VKRSTAVIVSVVLLLFASECGDTAVPAELSVSELSQILEDMSPSGAALTHYYDGMEETVDASRAIRAESYIETLQSYTWEEYQVPDEWDRSDETRCVFAAPGITLTAYERSCYDYTCPIHVETGGREGWFQLPELTEEEAEQPHDPMGGEPAPPIQSDWMAFHTLEKWYYEVCAAVFYGGDGTPLTAEELDWFTDYTTSERKIAGTTWGFRATEISCFFTSFYDDPRDMNACDFLRYCPSQEVLKAGDEAEFRMVQKKMNWRVGGDEHLATLEETPFPCHRLPRSYINEILTKYAGITVEEMHTDWLEEALYIPETDCFYTFTSDFGPGMFIPRYGERNGDIVTLWEAPNAESDTSDKLVLQKSGENWHILSHQLAAG